MARRIHRQFPSESDYAATLPIDMQDVFDSLSRLDGQSGLFRVKGWGKTRREIQTGVSEDGVDFTAVDPAVETGLEVADFLFRVKYTRFDADYNPVPSREDVFYIRAKQASGGVRVEVVLKEGPGLTEAGEVLETLRVGVSG